MFRNANLSSLSVELLVEIFSYIHHLDLFRCRQVSHALRTVIDETPLLKYSLCLGLTGYEDGDSLSDIRKRWDSLCRIQRTWRDPNLTLSHSVAVPSQEWVKVKWFKDLLVAAVPTDVRRLDVFRLNSAVSDAGRLQSLTFDVEFGAAYVDPGQDLVILTHYPPGPANGSVRPPPKLYLKTLSTQEPHPRAHEPVFDLAAYGFFWAPFSRRLRIQVSGDFLKVVVYKRLIIEAVLVWHWPTGTMNASLRPPSSTHYLDALCTSGGYLLLNTQRHRERNTAWYGISVYALHPAEETPRLLAIFGLPMLHWDPSSLLSSTFCPNYMLNEASSGALSVPMDCTPGCALIQLRMDGEYTLYVPLETLLSEPVLRDRHRVQPLEIAWDRWGPSGARIFQEPRHPVVVMGYRVVYADYVLDFCPHPVAVDALLGDPEAARATGELHRETSTLRASMFGDVPVDTSLPYHKTQLRLPPSAGPLTRDVIQLVLQDVDGPKLIRATCKDFVLVPTSVDVYSFGRA